MGLFGEIFDFLGLTEDPPEPDRNIGLSQVQMADLAKQQQQYFQTNFAPRLLNQMDQQTQLGWLQAAQQQQLQDYQMGLARKYDQRFWDTTAKQQDKFYGLVDQYTAPGEVERQAGQAGADVAQSFGIQNQMLGRARRRMGVNPSSDAAAAGMRSSANAEALARAGAMTAARQAAKDLGLRYTAAAAGMGDQMVGATQTAAQGAGAAGMNSLGAAGTGMGAITSAMNGFNANTQMVGNLWNNVGALGVGSDKNRMAGYQTYQNALSDISGTLMGYGLGKWG